MARFSFKQLYLYAMCLITLLIAVFGVFHLAEHIINLALPDSSQSPPTSVYDKRGLLNNVVQIVIAFPLYWYHWRLARRTE